MRHFFIKTSKHNQFYFFDDDLHHLKNVLKVKLGENIVCVYEDKKYLCKICQLNPIAATIVAPIEIDNEFKTIELNLFQAIIKPKHFEWIVAKSSELQLNNFYPTIFSRSQHHIIPKLDRMNNIAYGAAKQSGRSKLCNFFEPINFNTLLNNISNLDYVIVPYEDKQGEILGNCLQTINFNCKQLTKIGVVIGPEGGFSEEEIIKLKSLPNTRIVSLSKTILRSETAALYCLAVIIDNLLTKEVQ